MGPAGDAPGNGNTPNQRVKSAPSRCGGTTTQPEFSFWFSDVGWKVENYGTDPDIDVDIAPHEFRQGNDTQLDRGVTELLKLLETQPPFRPMPDDDPRQA